MTVTLICVAAAVGVVGLAGDYPEVRQGEDADVLHGMRVADPYRWLEDADSAETRAFIAAQNALTRQYVEGDVRERVRTRSEALIDYPRTGTPGREAGRLFYGKNTGTQNHSVLFTREDGGNKSVPLLDPNRWSDDGTVSMAFSSVSPDGKSLAYGISVGGSDDRVVRILDVPDALARVANGEDVEAAHFDETLTNMRFSGIAWSPDSRGFWYNQYPAPGTVEPGRERFDNKVFWHALDDDPAGNRVVFEYPKDPELGWFPYVTPNDLYLILYASRGTDRRSGIYYREVCCDPAIPGGFRELFPPQQAFYSVVDDPADGKLVILTDHEAPRRRLVRVDLRNPDPSGWETLIEEPAGRGTVLQGVVRAGDRYVATYLQDARSRLAHYDLDGGGRTEVELPTVGTVGGVTGSPHDGDIFFSFTGYTYPTTPFRYDLATGRLDATADNSPRGFDPEQYETKQVFYESRDGTRIPMFVTHRRGLELDGTNPTILYGYGGFNVSLTPGFSALRLAWLEQGGVYAVANLRGGGEYGREWHEAGKFARRQNVFDDFHAAAEFLVADGYTRPDRLAIEGGSNGGLLVAACVNQRPELYGAVLCHVPVIDMLRYHLWGTGRFWTVEYGNATESADDLEYLLRYSPLHTVRTTNDYPPILVLTGDGDDRVVPAHALKFVAALQAASPGSWPMLLRYDVGSGHGAGKPIAKVLDEQADVYAFLARALDFDWKTDRE